MQEKYTFYCKKCRKSTKVSFLVTDDDNTPVLPNIDIICTHCRRVLFLKKYTQRKLKESSVGNRFYI